MKTELFNSIRPLLKRSFNGTSEMMIDWNKGMQGEFIPKAEEILANYHINNGARRNNLPETWVNYQNPIEVSSEINNSLESNKRRPISLAVNFNSTFSGITNYFKKEEPIKKENKKELGFKGLNKENTVNNALEEQSWCNVTIYSKPIIIISWLMLIIGIIIVLVRNKRTIKEHNCRETLFKKKD
jgi:hypothetical protein